MYNFFWPKLSFLKQKLLMQGFQASKALQGIASTLNKNEYGSELEKVIDIRNWINRKSIHLIDDEHDQYAFKLQLVVAKVWAYHVKGGNPPHLSCGPRAYLMKEVLGQMGIRSRIIDIFEVKEKQCHSHTLIDVFDSEMNKWVLQDPDFNVVYVDKKTRECLSAADCLQYDAVDVDYESSGHEIENLGNLIGTIETFFEHAVLHRYSYDGQKSELVYKNKKIGSNEIVVHGGQSVPFSDYIKQRDFAPSIITLIE